MPDSVALQHEAERLLEGDEGSSPVALDLDAFVPPPATVKVQRGEHRLWFATLQQAIIDTHSADPVEREDALAWFNSASTSMQSFLWVCDELDLDSKRLRATVLLAMKNKSRKVLVTQLMHRVY